jgi:hypothetical protein
MQQGKLIQTVLAALLFAACTLSSALAQNNKAGEPTENTPADRALQGARLDEIRLSMRDSFATLTQLVVVTPDCAIRGGTSVNYRQNVNTLGFTQDLPLVGQFFVPTPRQGQLTDANQLGLAYIDNGTLFVDLRRSFAAANGDRSLLPTLTDAPTNAQNVPFSASGTAPAFIAFSVVNRDFQFQVPVGNFTAVVPGGAACGPGAMTKLPALGALFPQPVGTAHNLNGQLIVLIKPSIIAGY